MLETNSAGEIESPEGGFDFESHASTAAERFRSRRGHYVDCANEFERLIISFLQQADVHFHSVESRAKTIESFERKAAKPEDGSAEQPKYSDPLAQITDLAGVRIITYFLSDVRTVMSVIEKHFEVVEVSDKSSLLVEEQKLGYQSVHYLLRIGQERSGLAEYSAYRGTVVEVQVRTILQHAWAEIEHDIQYKSVDALPNSLRSRFLSLAGLLEIGDREFESISKDHEEIRRDAGRKFQQGKLDQIEITPDALRLYLNQKYGQDGRMSDWNYGWNARFLKRLGFENFAELEGAIGSYSDDFVSRAVWGRRQGQLQRFEDVLLAALGDGDRYWRRHPFRNMDGSMERRRRMLERMRDKGVTIGKFTPGGQ